MTCGGKPTDISWVDWCSQRSYCPECQLSRPIFTPSGGPVIVNNDPTGPGTIWRLWPDGRWEPLEGATLQEFLQELAQVSTGLPDDVVQRNRALANFYHQRGLEMLRIAALDEIVTTQAQADPALVTELAGALQSAGFHQAALLYYDYTPPLLATPWAAPERQKNVTLLQDALKGKAISYQMIGQDMEAQATNALADHLQNLADLAFQQ